MEKQQENRGSFRAGIGFVLAAAGSAVGLGNIWRFPYLAARDGGGLFLTVYVVMALTFGFTMLNTEIAIGQKTGQSPLSAYRTVHHRWGFLGKIACIIPVLILPYYCVIGGWVTRYFVSFAAGRGAQAADDDFFAAFITNQWEPLICLLVFLGLCAVVVWRGVQGGIEKLSRILMPILVLMVIGIAVFTLTIQRTDDGKTVTALEGFRIYAVPNLEGITPGRFLRIVIDAMTQLFYSLSIAMGIMVTYGSYVPKDANLPRSVTQIEIFDTVIAFLAGVMIVPAVYVFHGAEGLTEEGPSLMFVMLPKVFSEMGAVGGIVGAVFFAMVFFAALTSGISIMETIVSIIMDRFHYSRKKSTFITAATGLFIGVIICLGYNLLYFEARLPGENKAQLLDVFDFISNNLLMPVVALCTCILVGWVIKPKAVLDEMTLNGEQMRRKALYRVMIRYIAPVLILIILLISIGIL